MSPRYREVLKKIAPPHIIYWYKLLRHKLNGDKVSKPYLLGSGKLYESGVGVGEKWDEMGVHQYNFLLEHGLKPHHKFLDVGCGSLRGGVHFIKYLNKGNYFGVDSDQWLLDAAREVELPRYGVKSKAAHLLKRDDFDFSEFGTKFDYALAQSVFSHLPWNSILRCLANVEKILKSDGKFYATFFEVKDAKRRIEPIEHKPGAVITYPDKNRYHYEFDVFEELAKRVGLEVKYIGNWSHPRGQMMMVFTKPKRKIN